MKNSKIFRILALVVILSLLIVAIPATPVLAAGALDSLYPSSGPVGTEVVVSGSGFAATTYFMITLRNLSTGFSQIVAYGSTTSTGDILTSFYVPEVPKTLSTYYVQATVGTETVSAPFTVTPYIEGLSIAVN